MPNKCVAQGCSTVYLTEVSARKENVATFNFPVKKPELLDGWTRFANKPNWTATSMPLNLNCLACQIRYVWLKFEF